MIKLFFKFCLFISFLLLFYIFYQSEIYWDGENRKYYLVYTIVIFFFIVFFFIASFLNSNIQKYIIISFISILTSLYLFESYLYYANNYFKIIKKIGWGGANYDKRNMLEIYHDLKKNSSRVTISLQPTNHINKLENTKNFFFFSGVSKYQTIHCNENGYYSIYQSDRYGFNNPDEEWENNEIEYVLVGDSFTQGECVNRPNDIASVLRKISKKKVLNLGYSGNGPLIEYATLREYLTRNVKKVIWIYYEGNDLTDLRTELNSKILKKYLNNLSFSQNLTTKQNEIDNLSLEIIDKMYHLKNAWIEKPILKFIKLFNTRLLLKKNFTKNDVSENPYDDFKNIINLANELANKNNSKLYFVYLPSFYSYKYKKNFGKSNIQKIIYDLNIPFIDIDSEVFKNEENPLKLFPFEQYGHYTVDGYNKTAKIIYEKTK